MTIALVLGGAACLQDDIEKALALTSFDVIIACNMAATAWPGQLDHFVTFHAELIPHFVGLRRKAGYADPLAYWTCEGHVPPRGYAVNHVEKWGGSSGLMAVQVALIVAHKAILCGIPMEPSQAHFDRRGNWNDAIIHRRAWERHKADLANIRSMSGWTAKLLGNPDTDFIAHS